MNRKSIYQKSVHMTSNYEKYIYKKPINWKSIDKKSITNQSPRISGGGLVEISDVLFCEPGVPECLEVHV